MKNGPNPSTKELSANPEENATLRRIRAAVPTGAWLDESEVRSSSAPEKASDANNAFSLTVKEGSSVGAST